VEGFSLHPTRWGLTGKGQIRRTCVSLLLSFSQPLYWLLRCLRLSQLPALIRPKSRSSTRARATPSTAATTVARATITARVTTVGAETVVPSLQAFWDLPLALWSPARSPTRLKPRLPRLLARLTRSSPPTALASIAHTIRAPGRSLPRTACATSAHTNRPDSGITQRGSTGASFL
jgi:hypothetical protein